jgi:hypothetical protein
VSSAFEIPLVSRPQKFGVSLAGVFYNMTVRWNEPGGCWMLDIADVNDVLVVGGIPLVNGVDLLDQYGYLNFGGQLIVVTDFDASAPPTSSNLGSQSHLYFVTP